MPKTSIEWTERTWNPVRGCRRVSAGCEHCYAERQAARFSGLGQPYEGLVRLRATGKHGRPVWSGAGRFVAEALAEPLRWRKPARVFVNSMSDLFFEAFSFEQIAAVFGVMAAAPRHRFQLLTKRPARAREFFAWADKHGAGYDLCRAGLPNGLLACAWEATSGEAWGDEEPPEQLGVTPSAEVFGSAWPPHVDVGVSVEDQRTADERIPVLLSLREHVGGALWVSYEPALGGVEFSRWLATAGSSAACSHCGAWASAMCAPACPERTRREVEHRGGIDWIVIGGESGPGARPFDLAWARSTVAACKQAGVPVFVKQLGNFARDSAQMVKPGRDYPAVPRLLRLRDRKGSDMSEWPEDLRVREYPEVRRG